MRQKPCVLVLLLASACATAPVYQPSTTPVPTRLECAAGPTDRIGLGSLLDELADLRTLARNSRAPYTSELASSFDRASLTARPGESGWFANHDYAKPTLDPPTVLLDVSGPGVVTRIWSANPSGVVR